MSFVHAIRKRCPECNGVTQITKTESLDWKAISLVLGLIVFTLVTAIILKK